MASRYNTLCRLGVDQLPNFCTEYGLDDMDNASGSNHENAGHIIPFNGNVPLRSAPVSSPRLYPDQLYPSLLTCPNRSLVAGAQLACLVVKLFGSSQASVAHNVAPKSTSLLVSQNCNILMWICYESSDLKLRSSDVSVQIPDPRTWQCDDDHGFQSCFRLWTFNMESAIQFDHQQTMVCRQRWR